MTTKRTAKKRDEGPRARGIVAAFTHDEVVLLRAAADAFAATLNVLDGLHPDPEIRDDAKHLDEIAQLLRRANINRDFIEGAG